MSPPAQTAPRGHPELIVLSHPTDPPRIPTLTLFQETQGGRLVIVLCAVDSHPPATLTIDHDGAMLATSRPEVALGQRLGVTSSRNSLRLEIRDAGPRDGGKYSCTATNTHGNASATKVLVTRGESRGDALGFGVTMNAQNWGDTRSPWCGDIGVLWGVPSSVGSELLLELEKLPGFVSQNGKNQ